MTYRSWELDLSLDIVHLVSSNWFLLLFLLLGIYNKMGRNCSFFAHLSHSFYQIISILVVSLSWLLRLYVYKVISHSNLDDFFLSPLKLMPIVLIFWFFLFVKISKKMFGYRGHGKYSCLTHFNSSSFSDLPQDTICLSLAIG